MSESYDSGEEEDHGFHFDPTNQEVIQKYLQPKINNESCGDFIVTKDLYAKEPWLLDHTNDPFFMEDEWDYFTKRTQVSDKKIGCGNNVKRMITRDNNDGINRGHWRAATKKKTIIDEETGNIIGFKQSLTFIRSDNKSSEDCWIMKEFTLPVLKEFQGLVISKINRKKSSRNQVVQHEASASCTSNSQHHELSSSSRKQQQSINNSFCEEFAAAMMAMRDGEDAPNLQWMDHN